jgi:chromosome segregation ATPase
MSDKLTQDVRTAVDEIFQQKEEVAMRKQTEEALIKSAEKINELVASLEAKDVEIDEFTLKVEELEETVSELSAANEDFEKNLEKATSDFEAEKEVLTNRAKMAEEELENIKKDQLAQARFEALKGEGVSATDEKAVKDQVAKIREMEDGDFEAYKAERIELRRSVIAELEASSQEKTAEEKAAEEAAAAEKAASATEEVLSEEEKAAKEAAEAKAVLEDEEAAAADSGDPIEPMKAIAAMLNMEIMPSDDVRKKYRELGKAMAKKYERSEKSE